jgi:hypothetical protein
MKRHWSRKHAREFNTHDIDWIEKTPAFRA